MSAPGPRKSSPARASRSRKLIRDLTGLRALFNRRATARKLRLLQQLKPAELLRVADLEAYHDTLAFIRAYPENSRLLKAAEQELQTFGRRIETYLETTRDRRGRRLANSGFSGTAVVHPFTLEAVERLLKWYPDQVEIEWDDTSDDDLAAAFKPLLHLVALNENDALDYDSEIDLQSWLKRARGKGSRSDLETLVRLYTRSHLARSVQRSLFDEIGLSVRWQLGGSSAARNRKRLPVRRPFYQTRPLYRRSPDLRSELPKLAAPLQRVSARVGADYIRAIHEVMYVRFRELFPVTFANPAEVYRYEPGRGMQMILFGTCPDARLPLEANFGALMVRNGLPVGYGIGVPLFDRVEIAINTFPAFRSGESAFVFEEFFRLFYHHFGSRLFIVRSHQMGEDDDEPLQSGAFWFYYKLGFRAANARVRRRAERLHERIKTQSGYRVPLSELKKLSHTDVFLYADPSAVSELKEPSLIRLAYVVTRYFAERFDGDRRRGTEAAVKQVARVLKLDRWTDWSPPERIGLERLAPLVASIPDLNRWSEAEKRDLGRILRAKGGTRERDFVLRTLRLPRFRAALEALAGE